ncbi:MAG: M50 family metallopeptidase [Acidobacteriota bacterium]
MRLRPLLLPLGLALAAILLWSSIAVFPLKIFVVTLHEISHGLAAVLTGGRIERIELRSNEGGLCVTRGGWPFLVISAGYLGSMFWGAVLLVLGTRTRGDRGIVAAIGVLMLGVTLLWIRTLFGFVFGILWGAALLGVAAKLPARVSRVLLQTMGVVSCLYAVADIGSDVIARSVPGSDASALARLTGIPAIVWGLVWIAASIAVAIVALAVASRPGAADRPGTSPGAPDRIR